MRDRKKLMKLVRDINPLSESAFEILRITSNPDYSVADIIKTAECDAVLTANVLRVANSAYISLNYPVVSIDMAVSYLGERMVVNIALASCSSQFFDVSLEGYGSGKGEFWRHSLMTGIASRIVAGRGKTELNLNMVYTAGLLHDIGKTVISSMLEGTAHEIAEGIDKGAFSDYYEAEKSMLGFDHCYAGLLLAQRWRLPEPYREVVAFHHAPEGAAVEFEALCFAVHIGDIIAMICGAGTGADSLQYKINPAYSDYFEISAEDIQEIIMMTDSEFSTVTKSLKSS
jgi:putative nucleotidyltransferase with HDIG domain